MWAFPGLAMGRRSREPAVMNRRYFVRSAALSSLAELLPPGA